VLSRMLNESLKLPVQMVRRYSAMVALAGLESHDSVRLRAVGEALRESLSNTVSVEEKRIISLIEKRRSSLLYSDKEITVIDFGAGSSSSNRTKEEMEAGVISTVFVSDVCKASMPRFWATFLFKLIRKLEPLSCVELGSCVGISASYQAASLSMNGKGRLVTLEGSQEIAKIAQETLEWLGLRNVSVVTGSFRETMKSVLDSAKPIDFFFNDGHHDHDAVLKYFDDAFPSLSEDAVVVFDDISWSPGMRKAWAAIEHDERVAASISLRKLGIAFIGNNYASKERFRIPL